MLPRNLRLNNPGNIRHGQPWQGQADDQPDPAFVKFKSPAWGIRAMVKIWRTYKRRDSDGKLTVAELVGQWAPPSENKTPEYIKNVCTWTGFSPEYSFDPMSQEDCCKLVPAVVRQESGLVCQYTRDEILEGVKLGQM